MRFVLHMLLYRKNLLRSAKCQIEGLKLRSELKLEPRPTYSIPRGIITIIVFLFLVHNVVAQKKTSPSVVIREVNFKEVDSTMHHTLKNTNLFWKVLEKYTFFNHHIPANTYVYCGNNNKVYFIGISIIPTDNIDKLFKMQNKLNRGYLLKDLR